MTTIAMVGSRHLSSSQMSYCESVGSWYAELGAAAGGCTIVSGNAPGADQAYIRGVWLVHAPSVRIRLCLPWEGFEKGAIIGGEEIVLARDATPEQQRLALEEAGARPTGQLLLFIRNAQIVWEADMLFALSVGGSTGTGHAVRMARRLGKQVIEYRV